ncbi:MAG: [protein-PII] uridylyltransferase [Alcanivoracaceae bacterium]|nr:[protein-PII] uridylyltransferase [Alcanivoracaceae bacterium]
MSLLTPPIYAYKYLDVLKFNHIPKSFLPFFKQLLEQSDKDLVQDFYAQAEITQLVTSRAWYVEQIIIQLWKQYIKTKKITLIAVGGFGRGELHPFSDVDLLILKPQNNSSYNTEISQFIQSLWDIGLDVGQSVRTAHQCYQQAKDDVTVATNLMEARYILGNEKIFIRMTKKVTAKKIWKGEDFFSAKSDEQKRRHKKYSDTTYNVEPNIKEGPGGLRDIQMVSWVAQRFYQTNSLHELVDIGFLTEYEYIHLIKGQSFLWRVRFALHIIAGRKEDRILFDYQLKLARIFGFHDEGIKNPAVEQFMQIFYRNAMRLQRLNLRLLQLFDENILKEKHKDSVEDINQHFHIVNGFLEIKNTDLFHSTPTVWFELFSLIQKYPKLDGVRADTVRAMRHNINQIGNNFRNNKLVKKQFLKILQQNSKVAAVLNQMNRLGILARYLPVFGKIVGRMQFDLFHIYTVDQHSLFALRNLCLLRHGKTNVLRAKEIFDNIAKPYLVYIAALFHDIAKGREGHHADLGAIDAQQFCQNHGISDEDSTLIVWLVKYHLIMSETAQKRDLSDPETIKTFAQSADSLLKLRALYLLTIADISATDPKLWNHFKESLLHELFIKTKQYLTTNKEDISLDIIKQNLISKLLANGVFSTQVKQQINAFPEDLLNRLHTNKSHKILLLLAKKSPPIVANLSQQLNSSEKNHTSIEKRGNSIEFLIFSRDFKGLFYIMVAILEKYNFAVVDANINITKNKFALNTVQCLTEESPNSQDSMINELSTALKAEKFYDIAIKKYTPIREKVFKIKPKVKTLKSSRRNETLIEVICRDQHGLLALIAKTLFLLDISINAAKIVTVGARAEDNFWLSINQQALTTEQLATLQTKLLEIL